MCSQSRAPLFFLSIVTSPVLTLCTTRLLVCWPLTRSHVQLVSRSVVLFIGGGSVVVFVVARVVVIVISGKTRAKIAKSTNFIVAELWCLFVCISEKSQLQQRLQSIVNVGRVVSVCQCTKCTLVLVKIVVGW